MYWIRAKYSAIFDRTCFRVEFRSSLDFSFTNDIQIDEKLPPSKIECFLIVTHLDFHIRLTWGLSSFLVCHIISHGICRMLSFVNLHNNFSENFSRHVPSMIRIGCSHECTYRQNARHEEENIFFSFQIILVWLRSWSFHLYCLIIFEIALINIMREATKCYLIYRFHSTCWSVLCSARRTSAKVESVWRKLSYLFESQVKLDLTPIVFEARKKRGEIGAN